MKAADYRQYAVDCVEIAGRVSIDEQRTRLLQMAERWRSLAQSTEAEEVAAAETAMRAATAVRRAGPARVLS